MSLFWCFHHHLNSTAEAVVAVEGFDHAKVIDLVLEVVVVLQGVVVDLNAILKANLSAAEILQWGGKPCSANDIGGLIYAILEVRQIYQLSLSYADLVCFLACRCCPRCCHPTGSW